MTIDVLRNMFLIRLLKYQLISETFCFLSGRETPNTYHKHVGQDGKEFNL